MKGRKVYIQRFTKFHEWVKFRAVVLGSSSGSAYRLHLRRGRYTLRTNAGFAVRHWNGL